ncbi:Protein NipSnap 3A [Chionoecetes opilio]|uniref:Protein NipSnap 3A n=1 Tax=Chionoecetes opilio TaxID=41210 RepID=A0A8J4YL07_CHIOP|nr:Protein NipSnap 3A [Chionoecetes opilio]
MSVIGNIRWTMIRHTGSRGGINRRFTTGAPFKQVHGAASEARSPVYELRTYTIYADKMREYLDLTAKEFHLRTSHSKLTGFWTSEIGGLNQAVHIWEYGSLSERADVRARLAADSEWLGRYVSRMAPSLQCQDNALLTLLPGRQINLPMNKGVYELQTLYLRGASAVWSKALLSWVQACEAASKAEGSMAVGVWGSVLGAREMAVILWQHPGPDGCLALADAAATLSEGETLASLVTSSHSKLLLPHAVSPMQ